ncbi:MAG: beta-N-acetylhexosaminidase [Lachnospiraceae bacterium]|jgi:beta-N-acetylhexosaminidase
MNLRTKLGQMICVGYDGLSPSEEFLHMIDEYKVGNIPLFRHNFESAQQAKQSVEALYNYVTAATGYPPILSVDQEGGMVTRFSDDFTHFPGAMAVAATRNSEYAYQLGYLTGLEIKNIGANWDLAPVADINTNVSNPVIGVRSYGDTVSQVIEFSGAMIDGLEAANVGSMMKHFPGHGDTHQDSHFSLPRIEKTYEELLECELKPFIEGIKQGVPGIMTSHIIFPAIDPSGVPATMSKIIITDILRKKLGFEGIIRTDDLEMDAIAKHYGIVEGAVMAIKAGVDIISMSRSPHLVKELVERVENEISNGLLPMELIDNAFNRIVKIKARYCRSVPHNLSVIGCSAHKNLANEISQNSITLIRTKENQIPVRSENLLVVGTHAFNQTNIHNPLLLELNFANLVSNALHGTGITISVKPTDEEITQVMKAAQAADTIIFGTYNAHLFDGQVQLANFLAATGKNLILAAMRNPYDATVLPTQTTLLACYEYTPCSINTLISVLSGELKPTGHLPITL